MTKSDSNSAQFKTEKRNPSLDEYMELREVAGMKPRDRASAKIGIENSVFSVCITLDNRVVGMGRIIGDRGTALQITDMAVRPEFQGQGLGGQVLKALVHYIETEMHPTVFVSLIADKGAVDFYKKYGFQARESHEPGMFLQRPAFCGLAGS